MTSGKCNDESVGILLHAYELGLLSPDERDIFETHLLSCDYCHGEVKQFIPRGLMLSKSPDVKHAMDEKIDSVRRRLLTRQKARQYNRPGILFAFRPAFLYLVILLLLIPSYFGVKKIFESGSVPEIRPVQLIYLTPTRSPINSVFDSAKEMDGIIFVACPGADQKSSYLLKILTDDNTPVFVIEKFDKFDERGTAQLILPRTLMSKGDYQLIIGESTADSLRILCRYEFGIQ
ncbi:MAG: zf-HC2 domain-containing protein [Candidatus Zixiibacteriota bacterium]